MPVQHNGIQQHNEREKLSLALTLALSVTRLSVSWISITIHLEEAEEIWIEFTSRNNMVWCNNSNNDAVQHYSTESNNWTVHFVVIVQQFSLLGMSEASTGGLRFYYCEQSAFLEVQTC